MNTFSKRMISLLLVLTLLVSTAGFAVVGAETEETYKLGDVNKDGIVSIQDATTIQLYLAKKLSFLDTIQQYLAGVNGRVGMSITNVTYIQMYLAGFEITFPTNTDNYAIGDSVTFSSRTVVDSTEATDTETTATETTIETTEETTAQTTEETTEVTTAETTQATEVTTVASTDPTYSVEQSTSPASGATPEVTIQADSVEAYTLKNLFISYTVQNFYIASKYIYITQRVGSTTYLSRLTIDEEAKTATYKDHMTLKNAGHGQSLDMVTYNGVNYLYLGCKPETYSTNNYYFSLQAARLEYEAGASYDYTELTRFTYMNYANPTATRLGTTYRVAVGCNSKYTIFRIQTEEGTITYSIYDTVAINKLLDETTNKQVRMDSEEAKAACITSFTQSSADGNIVRPNGSFQGVDLLGDSDIFITGGADGDTPMMAHMSNTGEYKRLVKLVNVGEVEIEGVQCKNSNVYFLLVDKNNKKNNQQIRYIPESFFE